MQHSISQDNTSGDAKLTRVLLLCGVVAGPLYILVGGIEMLTRPGFDPTRHDQPTASHPERQLTLMQSVGTACCTSSVGGSASSG